MITNIISIIIALMLVNTNSSERHELLINPPYNFQIDNATSVGQNPSMSWTATPGTEYFKVYRKIVGIDAGYVYIASTTSENYTDLCMEVTSGDEDVVWYRVTAVGGSTESSPSNAASVYASITLNPGCSI